VLFSIFTAHYAVSISSQLPFYYHHGILFFAWTIVFLAFYGFFTNEINKLIGNTMASNYIKWLGKNVTIMYFIQWVIIGNIATEVYKTVSSPVYLVVSYLVILFVSSALCWMYLKIRKQKEASTN